MSEEKSKKKTSAGASKGKSAPKDTGAPVEGVYPRLRKKYEDEIIKKLKDEFNYKSSMQVPRLQKIVINAGLGKAAVLNIKVIDQAMRDLATLSGQKAVSCKSKKAISNFKLRAGLPIGVMVTLRGNRMYEFLDRLVYLALPRIRDFRGINDRGFDGRGNYTLGLKDQHVFPEVPYDTGDATFGLNISFSTTAKTDKEGLALLTHFGMPWRKRSTPAKQAA